MKKSLFFAIAACGLLAVSQADAKPARRGLVDVRQPDGSTITIKRIGDEFSHLALTPDGRLLTTDERGMMHVASEKALTDNEIDDILQSRRMSSMHRTPAQSGMGLFDHSFPATGESRSLVILVEYKDVAFQTENAFEYFNNMLNQDGFSMLGGTGSARQYFIDNSDSIFVPTFDVVGPVTLPNNRSYYGGNNYWGNDKNPEKMVIHACEILDDEVDFSLYDMNSDGVVDNIYIYYAGEGEAGYGSAETVWPHSWNISAAQSTPVIHDGVRIDRYACSNEVENSIPDGIGTFVHEFSHVMGLPDLYNTSYSSADYTPNEWSVLDYACYLNDSRTPAGYSAFERNALGWIDPMVIDGPASITLLPISKSNKCCLIQTEKEKEFFLFENRQKIGWDTYLPGSGMLIWHIDFVESVWSGNSVNNNKSHQYVDIVEANGRTGTSSSTLRGYAWPGTSNKTSFTGSTTPAFKSWSGTVIDLPITGIAEINDKIVFDVAGGKHEITWNDLKPEVHNATDVTETGFTAHWAELEGAVDYRLTVSKVVPGSESSASVTCDFGSGATLTLPEGWSTNVKNSDVYTSSGYFGESAPSIKFGSNEAFLMSPTFDLPMKSISFWCRGAGTSPANTIDVDVLVDNEWVTLFALNPIPTASKGGNIVVDSIPSSADSFRLLYHKVGNGNVAIDDVKVEFTNDSYEPLEGYNHIPTGNVTQWVVEGIDDNLSRYVYTVSALNEDGEETLQSRMVEVELATSSVGNIVTDADSKPEFFNLQGMKVSGTPAPGIYIERRGTSARKVYVK